MKEIIKTINETNHNFVFSPVALYYALIILAQTTSGDTRKEILNAIGLAEDELIKTSKELHDSLNINAIGDGKVMLNASLWLNDRFNVNENKCKDIAVNNNSAIRKVKMGSSDADRQIQKWVNVNTNNFLKESVSNIKTNAITLMELITTIYLKGSWEEYFNKRFTKKEDFHLLDNKKTKCDFMNGSQEGNVYFGKRFTAAKLNIVNLGSMTFILPNEGLSPNDISNDDDLLDILNGKMYDLDKKVYDINLSIPKFDISANSDIIANISQLGINKALNMNEADFSPISNEKELCITDASQAARIKIDEEGIEAAAYVCMNVGFGGMVMPQFEKYNFVLDRPFMFSVTKGDTPLFVGTIVNPK